MPVLPPASELSDHLRLASGFLDDGSEDPLLETYLRNAIAVIERHLSQALIRRRFELKVSRWSRDGHLILPIGPVEAIESFELVSSAGAVSIDGDWTLELASSRQRLSGVAGTGLPVIPVGHWAEIAFVAGHAESWAGVPADLQQAVMELAAHFYDFRGASGRTENNLPPAVAGLVEPHLPVRL